MANLQQEAERIRTAYIRRDASGKADLYKWNRPEVLFSNFRIKSVIAQALMEAGWTDWRDKECLDVGCGRGEWLRTIQEWGADPGRIHGIDLLPDRIERARQLSPGVDFRVSNSWPIPFADESLDLISANMVFSSILDESARSMLAEEMKRVIRKEGLILIYEFRFSNPGNPDTIGIGKRELRRLFPNYRLEMRSVTLAPPLMRRLATISSLVAHATEALFPFLRTHAVFVLHPAAIDERSGD